MDLLQSMSIFARVVESGSFSDVAKQAGVTQPTISKTIQALEKRLEARLLNRSTRHVLPTEIGRKYHEECRRILEAVDRAQENVRTGQSIPAGNLKLSVPISFGRLYMVSRVAALLGKFPLLTVELAMNDHPVDVIKEGYDLAIRTGELDESSLIARKIGRNHRVMAASPRYLDARGTPRSPRDLQRHNCIRTADRWLLQGPRGELTADVSGNLVVNNAEAVREALLAHLGIGIVPLWAVHEEIGKGLLQVVLPNYSPVAKDIYAVYPYTRQPSSKLRAFIDFIEGDLRGLNYRRKLGGLRPRSARRSH